MPSTRLPEGGGLSEEWQFVTPVEPVGGPAFGRMIQAFRQLQDCVAEARPPNDVVARIAADLEELEAFLTPYRVDERNRIAGNRWDLPGRGQFLIPPISLIDANAERACGFVTLNSPYLGSGGAANGGFLPLLFNELMGRLVQMGGRQYSRTAYLHVNFRSVARIGAQLRIEVKVLREEGRKRFVGGTLHEGSVLVADAEALFVAVKESGAGADNISAQVDPS